MVLTAPLGLKIAWQKRQAVKMVNGGSDFKRWLLDESGVNISSCHIEISEYVTLI